MKSLLLMSMLWSAGSPVVQANAYENNLNSYAKNEIKFNINENASKSIFGKIAEKKKEVLNITKKVKETLVRGKKNLDDETKKEISELSSYIYSGSKTSRHWTEWWGANLWINLTKKETDNYLKFLYPYALVSNGITIINGLLSDAESSLGVANEFLQGTKISDVIDYIRIILLTATAVIGTVNDLFNYYKIKELANQGGGVVSFRMTFGFLYSGVFPGYKYIEK